MSRIWLINQYASTPTTGIGGRHHYLAKELVRLGHEVTLIAARRHHLLGEDVDVDTLPTEEQVDGYRLIRIDVPRYSHAHSKRRILAWLTFAVKIPNLRRQKRAAPDAVLCSSPSLVSYLGAEWLAKATGARLVFEARDMWPLTLVEIGGYSSLHPFIRLLQWIEDRAYTRSNRVVSNAKGAVDHMVSRGMDRNKFTWVSNGIALDEVQNPIPLAADFKAHIPTDGLRVVYTGTLGAANALETLIDAAALLRDLPDVHILLVGQGRLRVDLEARCHALGLRNVRFLGPVSKAQVQAVLAECDVCYIGWMKSPLYRWGIAANKIPEYLFSGKPILHAFSGGNDPISEFDAGITIPAEDPQALADAIRRLHAMPEAERQRLGTNGHRAAREYYDYAKLAQRLEKVLVG